MSEQTVSENLQHLIKLHNGISILELSKRTQIPQPTLHHILNGQTKKPRKQALEALAKFFSITVEQLTGTHSLPKIPFALKENLKISTVPIIDWNMIKNDEKKTSPKEIILDKKVGEKSFAAIMPDTSMEPLFPENSLLVFDSDKKCKDRDFVVTLLAHNNEVVFNRIFIDDSEYFIKHNTPNSESKLLKLNLLEDKIIATLIEARMQF